MVCSGCPQGRNAEVEQAGVDDEDQGVLFFEYSKRLENI